jgi:hypothetical protein
MTRRSKADPPAPVSQADEGPGLFDNPNPGSNGEPNTDTPSKNGDTITGGDAGATVEAPTEPTGQPDPATPASRISDPVITPEGGDDTIHVGASGLLTIPREDDDDDDDGGDENTGCEIKIRKPGRREYVVLDPDRMLPVKVISHKPDGDDSVREDFYYVPKDSPLRQPLRDEMKLAHVWLYYSPRSRRFRLWIVKVNVGNEWYDSLHARLFRKLPEFYKTHEFRVWGDQEQRHYRVKQRERSPDPVPWPVRDVGTLLAEALGDNVITSADHPMFKELVSGKEVG